MNRFYSIVLLAAFYIPGVGSAEAQSAAFTGPDVPCADQAEGWDREWCSVEWAIAAIRAQLSDQQKTVQPGLQEQLRMQEARRQRLQAMTPEERTQLTRQAERARQARR